MKLIASLFVASIVFIFTSAAFAIDPMYGLEVGFRQQSGDGPLGFTPASQSGFQFGATAAIPVHGKIAFRTGMLYTQRPLKLKQDSSGIDTSVNLNYLDVPVNLMVKFEDYAGVYVGVNLALNIDKSANNTNFAVRDVKSMLVPFTFGVSFKFAPQLGATLYYESAGSTVAQNLSNYRAVGANLLVTFD